VVKAEKALSYGPSSTISGKWYRVQYFVEFYTKHEGIGSALASMPVARIPLMVDCPDRKVMDYTQLKSKLTPGWQPYSYKYRILVVTKEEEWTIRYARFRKEQIAREKIVEDNLLAKAAGLKFRSVSLGLNTAKTFENL
jgi:hypothetical protein